LFLNLMLKYSKVILNFEYPMSNIHLGGRFFKSFA